MAGARLLGGRHFTVVGKLFGFTVVFLEFCSFLGCKTTLNLFLLSPRVWVRTPVSKIRVDVHTSCSEPFGFPGFQPTFLRATYIPLGERGFVQQTFAPGACGN